MIFLRIRQARFIPGMNAGAFASQLGKEEVLDIIKSLKNVTSEIKYSF